MALGEKGHNFAQRMSSLPSMVSGILDEMHVVVTEVEGLVAELNTKKEAFHANMRETKEGVRAAIGAMDMLSNGDPTESQSNG